MNPEKEVALWTLAFRNRAGSNSDHAAGTQHSDCPTSEAIWDTATGVSSVKARRKIVEHTVTCSECAQSWRMARELGEAAQQNAYGEGKVVTFRPKAARAAWGGVLAAAAVLVMAFGIGLFKPWQADTSVQPAIPVMRGAESLQLKSHIEGEQLSRTGVQLRWTIEPQIEGASYQVRVTGEDLFKVVFQAENLKHPSVVIPGEMLQSLPSGSHLLWQVTITTPDGTTKSASFVNPIE